MTVNAYEPVTLSEATGNTEHVYELQCTGDNLFYANGIMAEGINEDELKAIADAAEETPEEKPAKKTTKKIQQKDGGAVNRRAKIIRSQRDNTMGVIYVKILNHGRRWADSRSIFLIV